MIEHYSRLLRDEKLSIGRFLTIMANMDNKIVFEEHEYPPLDVDEIEFETSDELEKVKVLLGLSTATDSSPVVLNSGNLVIFFI